MGADLRSRVGRPPVLLASQSELRAAKAICRPSGESAGRWMPRTGRARASARSYSLVSYRGRRTGSTPSKGMVSGSSSGLSGRTRVKAPSTVRSSSPAGVQRGGTGATSPVTGTGRPSTTRVQEPFGAAVVRRWARVPSEATAGVMTCAASVSVCRTVTGPVPSAGTAAIVRASRLTPCGVVTVFARTNRTRVPSGDQVGSKSSHGSSCSGPSWAGRPVTRVMRPVRRSRTWMRYGLPSTGSPPRSEAKARRVPSGDQAGPRSSQGPSVRCRRPEPSGRTVQRWKPPPR